MDKIYQQIQAKKAVIVFLALVIFVTGCASRPTIEALTSSIQSSANTIEGGAMTPEIARCIAEGLLATDLSDTTLQGLSEDFNNAEVLTPEIELTNEIIIELRTTCGATQVP